LFQYSVAVQHLRLDQYFKGRMNREELRPLLKQFNGKIAR